MKDNIAKLEKYAKRFKDGLKEKGFNADYVVKNIWIDYGANWKEETIIVNFVDKDGKQDSFQTLSPRDLKEIKEDSFADKDFNRLLNDHVVMFSKYGWGKQ